MKLIDRNTWLNRDETPVTVVKQKIRSTAIHLKSDLLLLNTHTGNLLFAMHLLKAERGSRSDVGKQCHHFAVGGE